MRLVVLLQPQEVGRVPESEVGLNNYAETDELGL